MAEWKVGETLYAVPRYRSPSTVRIEKVGRKWLYLSNQWRVDKQTMYADGGGYCSPGRCWTDSAAHEEHCERIRLLGKFARAVQRLNEPPIEAIKAAADLLGINLEETDG